MKKLFIRIFFIPFFFGLLNYCSEPNPVELISEKDNDPDAYEYELLTPNPGEIDTFDGIDSLGMRSVFPEKSLIGGLTIQKTVAENFTWYSVYCYGYFFDKNLPVYSPDSKLIGYRGLDKGTLSFNQHELVKTEHKIKFSYNGTLRDTVAGTRYFLSRKLGSKSDLTFRYRENFDIILVEPGGNTIRSTFSSPEELSAVTQISMNGDEIKNILVRWNGNNEGKIDMIFSYNPVISGVTVPLFRLKTNDDGSIRIPGNLFKRIPRLFRERLFLTLIRRTENSFNALGYDDSFIFANSILSFRVKFN